jgi:hypothetical protein
MKIASHHSQVCLDVFINCKNLLTGLGKEAVSLPSPVAKLLNECAQICMGICEECAEVCDCFDNSIFKQCAQTCRYCSNSISELARLN